MRKLSSMVGFASILATAMDPGPYTIGDVTIKPRKPTKAPRTQPKRSREEKRTARRKTMRLRKQRGWR